MYISEHSELEDSSHIYLHDDESAEGSIKISLVDGNLQVSVDVSFDRLASLRDLINHALDELDDKRKCPECGYTLEDAKFNLDHRICRKFPYFQYERPSLPVSEEIPR